MNTKTRKVLDDFSWGPVVNVFEVGPYLVFEYHPMIFEGSSGTGKYEPKKTEFASYVMKNRQWQDTHSGHETLEGALAHAIAYRFDGENTRADRYFLRRIGQ